jgi:Tol biopolymer transport system component/tRNA A-37 threonylcarbamoyl transferase component Bud32
VDPLSQLNVALAGRYTLDREIGRGGMATVYLAADHKHNRKVAIKVLREDLAASVGATRFLREIQIAAQLQHPNVLPLLDSGDAGGVLYYVMPFVEGQSLRQRLARDRELPVGEAVRLVAELVDALAHAHAHGVVHRDIKPDNVMLSGRHALVTDFGVARAVSEASGGGTMTSMGVALGTPAYMAPEQAAADPNVDQRADIYAVGVVAYELIAGRLPFSATTPQQMLAAHVTETPDPLSRHRPGVSPALETIVMRCLEKRPADRWQKAEDLLAALEPLATPGGGTMPTMAVKGATSFSGRTILVAGAAVIVVAAIAVAASVRGRAETGEALGRSNAITSDPGLELYPAISPDGKFVAYAAGNSAAMRIFVRPVGGGRTIPLSDDSTAIEWLPRWAPDGTKLLFLVRGGVSVAPAFGGGSAARQLAPATGTGAVVSAAWAPDESAIAYVRSDSLYIAPMDGAPPRLLTTVTDLSACEWSPDGRWLACVRGNAFYLPPGGTFGNIAPSAIVLVSRETGKTIDVTSSAALNHTPVWSSDAARLYFISNRDGPRDVYVQTIRRNGEADGTARRLSTGLDAQTISVSKDGSRVAYAVLHSRANLWALPIPRGAAPVSPESAVPVTTGNQTIEGFTVSVDGKWMLYDSNVRGNQDIYRVALTGGQPEQLTREPFDEFSPDLSPDGKLLAYHSFRTPGRRQIEVRPLDGGPVEQATDTTGQESNPRWSPDGSTLSSFEIAQPFVTRVTARRGPARWDPSRELCRCFATDWSRDGATLLVVEFAIERGEPRGQLGLVPVAGGPIQPLLSRGAQDEPPEEALFSTDYSTIYFKTHDRGGRASLWSMPATGGTPRRLVRFDNPDRPSFRPTFAVDGARFYFTIDDRQSDVFVAEVTRRR